MLRTFRSSLDSWLVRAFFGLLALAFMGWGVGDVLNSNVSGTDAANVGSRRVSADELNEAYRRQLQQLASRLGDQQPTPQMRVELARQSLDRLITQASVIDAAGKLGLAVSDDAVRAAVFDIPAFHNAAGQFDRTQMLTVLSQNGLNETRFLALMRDQLLSNQLIGTMRSAVTAPEGLVRAAYDAQRETRTADLAAFDYSAVPIPAAPSEAEQQRWWENHPDLYSSTEFRHITAIVLAPETIARGIEVSAADEQAWYDQHRGEFNVAAKRSAEMVMINEAASADAIAKLWRDGAGWDEVQKAATDAHDTPLAMSDFTPSELPDPDLAKAVFAAAQGRVEGPVKTALGSALFRVTAITDGRNASLDDVRAEVHARVAAERAGDLLYDRANKVEDLLAGGAKLEEMPDDLGLAGVAGTLDANGMTAEGAPAPLPGGSELRAEIIKAAFAAKIGDQPRLIETPSHAYFALSVDTIDAPETIPLDHVRERVVTDIVHDQIRATQNAAATRLLLAVRSGAPLEVAGREAGARVSRTPPIPRDANPPAGVPPQLVPVLFSMKDGAPNTANMVETPYGFIVVTLAGVQHPDPAADPEGVSRLRAELTRSMGDDAEIVATAALRARAAPRVNMKIVDQIAQP